MKKVILVLAFVFATGSFINAESNSNNEAINSVTERVILDEDFGCVRDCVNAAIEESLNQAFAMLRIERIEASHMLYEDCYYANCV